MLGEGRLARFQCFTGEESLGLVESSDETAVSPLQPCVNVTAEVVSQSIQHTTLREPAQELRVRKYIDRTVIFSSVAPPKCLRHTLGEACLREGGVAQVCGHELLEVTRRHRDLGNDLDPARIAGKVHPVVAAGGHEMACIFGCEWLIRAVIALQPSDATK
jgi:hypothetical protein